MVLYSAMAPKALWKPKGHAKAKAACKLVDKDSVGEKSRWQFRAGRFVYQEHIDLAKVLEHFGDKVSEYSAAREAGTHDHTDVYLVFVKKQDWTSMEPCTIDGHVPHFTANTTSGSGYRNACNRGHFYNQCEGKKGTTARVTNHPPGEAYAVKSQWIVDLYQQGKLDTPLAAAGIYKCLTPQLEAMVNRSSAYRNNHLRDDFKKKHAEALQAKILPYRTAGPDVEAIASWQGQYSTTQFRYYPALMRSIKKFAETWRVILCGIEEGPWNVNDIEIALRSAELAVELSLPQVGNAVMLHEHGNAFLEALAGVDLALLEKSGRVCSFVEEMLRSTCAQKRAAATAVFYRSGSGAHVPRITLAKRLEHAINSEADEFIVFWHHEYKQFNFIEGQDMESFFETEKQRLLSQGLAEHDGKPWYRQARVGPYNLVVRYYLFGAEPHVNEPVSATLAGGSHLCATLVYAWCTRLDRASGQTKKRLLQAVSISAHCASLQASANTCSTCSASNAYLCAPVHRAPSMVAARPSGRDEQTDVDKEVERANEEARNRKLLTKRLAVQPSLAGPTLAAKEADGPGSSGPGVSSETNLSKSARRSQENKAKQRRAEKHRDEVKQQRADNEFRKVLEAVEPLRQESDTVVREDLESLESVKDLDALLQKAEKQAKAKPRRQLAEKEAELAHALLGTGQLRGRVHREVKDFIESFPGIAPDAQTFAERLVEALLGDEAIEFFDAHVAAELYGDFADAFVGRDWSERRLAHVGHRVILRAAALA